MTTASICTVSPTFTLPMPSRPELTTVLVVTAVRLVKSVERSLTLVIDRVVLTLRHRADLGVDGLVAGPAAAYGLTVDGGPPPASPPGPPNAPNPGPPGPRRGPAWPGLGVAGAVADGALVGGVVVVPELCADATLTPTMARAPAVTVAMATVRMVRARRRPFPAGGTG